MDFGGVRGRRLLLGALVLGVIWFIMFFAILVNHQTERIILVPSNVISKHLKLVGIRHALHSNSALIYVSKRRVPNGPDPIHNRRAVKARQPPTRA